jgi:hypothetical protein
MRCFVAEPPGAEAAELAARREHAMTRNDQRHWILRHCLADGARGFRIRAELL